MKNNIRAGEQRNLENRRQRLIQTQLLLQNRRKRRFKMLTALGTRNKKRRQ